MGAMSSELRALILQAKNRQVAWCEVASVANREGNQEVARIAKEAQKAMEGLLKVEAKFCGIIGPQEAVQ